MSSREPHQHGGDPFLESEGGEEQSWLVSYADLMTLLFGFFALMFSFATFDAGGASRVSRALSKSFGEQQDSQAKVTQQVKKALAPQIDSKLIEVTEKEGELQVALTSSFLFESGKATLVAPSIAPLQAFIEGILPNKDRLLIVVEGHTDDAPISTPEFKSNWELSSARAATIVHFLEDANFPSLGLEAVGFGSTRPLVPNRTPAGVPLVENQAKNRRVLIRVKLKDEN